MSAGHLVHTKEVPIAFTLSLLIQLILTHPILTLPILLVQSRFHPLQHLPRRSIAKAEEEAEEFAEKNPIVENLSNSDLARISSSMNLSMLNFMQR